MNVLLRIASYTLKFKPYLFLGYVCTIGAVASYLMIPELLGGIVDKIDPNSQNDSIYKSANPFACTSLACPENCIGKLAPFTSFLGFS